MSEPAFWRWNKRIAELTGNILAVTSPPALAVVAFIKRYPLVHATDSDPAWLIAIIVFTLAGLVLLITGILGRFARYGPFKPDRGRGDTIRMLIGSGFLVIAGVGLLTF